MKKPSKEEILESLKSLEEIINKELGCLENFNQEKCSDPRSIISRLEEGDITESCKDYLNYLVSKTIEKLRHIQELRELLSAFYREGKIRVVKPMIYDAVAYYSTKSKGISIYSSDLISERCSENHKNSKESLDIVDRVLIDAILHETIHAYDHQINNLELKSCIENLVSEIKGYSVSSAITEDKYLLGQLLEDSIDKLKRGVETFSLQKLALVEWIESCRRYLKMSVGSSIDIPEIKEKYEDLMKKISEIEELYRCFFKTSENGSLIGGILGYYLLHMNAEDRMKFIENIIKKRTLDDIILIFKEIKRKVGPLDIDMDLDTERRSLIINYKNEKYILNLKN